MAQGGLPGTALPGTATRTWAWGGAELPGSGGNFEGLRAAGVTVVNGVLLELDRPAGPGGGNLPPPRPTTATACAPAKLWLCAGVGLAMASSPLTRSLTPLSPTLLNGLTTHSLTRHSLTQSLQPDSLPLPLTHPLARPGSHGCLLEGTRGTDAGPCGRRAVDWTNIPAVIGAGRMRGVTG